MRLKHLFTCAALAATPLAASDDCTEDAMVVFDGSGSMAEMGFNQIDAPRIVEARQAIADVMPELAANRRLGLVIYGPGGVDGCTGLDVRFAPQAAAARRIIRDVNALEPAGDTALTEAVARAATVLDYTQKPGTIVLVTDGKETCGGAPCQLASVLAADGPGLTVHVIGFKVRGTHFSWESEGGTDYTEADTVSRCLADRTGGTYASAETLDDLIAALRVSLGCKVLY